MKNLKNNKKKLFVISNGKLVTVVYLQRVRQSKQSWPGRKIWKSFEKQYIFENPLDAIRSGGWIRIKISENRKSAKKSVLSCCHMESNFTVIYWDIPGSWLALLHFISRAVLATKVSIFHYFEDTLDYIKWIMW